MLRRVSVEEQRPFYSNGSKKGQSALSQRLLTLARECLALAVDIRLVACRQCSFGSSRL
jgi:hypothetical protein